MPVQTIETIVANALAFLIEWLDKADPAAITALLVVLTDVQSILTELLQTVNSYLQSPSVSVTTQQTVNQPEGTSQSPSISSGRPTVYGVGGSSPVPKGTVVRHG